ncbi:efflux RND transporter periplasmic adaptor subunit [Alcanivorax marinus]|uniref:Efflux RND transporter periplasmic adaptor subunit n=1 Tax=Alloalcanivorax marinus TaxID=1177169 RepID=A0A9Q3YPF5_9GAMM|nr:efflux RND transporter periplasmic adaptor subunit [Alloalcanivorax marinus]MCC4309781.1 efflux RND transporter periplasmic adaptor subunit [Alloalcanivorax marinus]
MSRVIGAIGSVALAVLALAGCGEPPPREKAGPVPVKLATVDRGEDGGRSFPGRVMATERSQLAFRVSGELVELPVKDGEQVKKGQLLARLDPRDFQNELDRSQADAELAEKNYRRGQALAERGMIAESELDRLSSRYQQARSAYKLARDNLSYTRLVAPYDGVVASTEQENHQFVQARETVIHLQSSATIDVRFSVPQSFIARAAPLDQSFQAEVIFPALPERRFPAVYREHEARSGATQAYFVVVTLPVPEDLSVLPGMSAEVRVGKDQLNGEQRSRLRIPVAAVFNQDGQEGAWVWRLDQEAGTVHAETVTLGEISGSGVEIVDGLKVGDQVVSAGVHRLEEGQAVRELTRERGL